MVDELGHPDISEMTLGAVLAALTDPHRRSVVSDLIRDRSAEPGERTCASFGLPVSKSSVTHHFKVLREAGIVRDVDYGNRRGVTLRRDDLDARFPGLLGMLEHEISLGGAGARGSVV